MVNLAGLPFRYGACLLMRGTMVVVCLGCLLQSDNLMGLPGRGVRPKNTLPLLTSTVKMDAEDPAMRCCFR